MPTRRALVVAAVLGVVMGLYLVEWQRWPTFLGVAVGATMALAVLLVAAKLSDDPAAADAAWRAAAPELAGRARDPSVEPAPDGWPGPDPKRP